MSQQTEPTYDVESSPLFSLLTQHYFPFLKVLLCFCGYACLRVSLATFSSICDDNLLSAYLRCPRRLFLSPRNRDRSGEGGDSSANINLLTIFLECERFAFMWLFLLVVSFIMFVSSQCEFSLIWRFGGHL